MKALRVFALALALILLALPASATRYDLPDGRFVILSLGGSYGYARDSTGSIYVWGDNQFGQLGKGYANPEFSPNYPKEFVTRNEAIDLNKISDVEASSNYSFLVMEDGTLFGVGNNSYLSLACGEGIFSTHRRVELPEKPIAIANGFGHVLALTEKGEVYAWGRNNKGQVGNGSTRHVMTPVKLPLQNIIQICGGGQFSLALDRDGHLWGWGDNEFHALSGSNEAYIAYPFVLDTGNIEIASIEAGSGHIVVLDKQGKVWAWGRNDVYQSGIESKGKPVIQPSVVSLPFPAVSLTTYNSQNYAILSNGSLWSWGNNGRGQLGQGLSKVAGGLPGQCVESDVVLVETGSMFAMCMLQDGRIMSAGFNNHYELGFHDTANHNTMTFNGMDLILN